MHKTLIKEIVALDKDKVGNFLKEKIKEKVLTGNYVLVDGTKKDDCLLIFFPPIERMSGDVLKLLVDENLGITMVRKTDKFVENVRNKNVTFDIEKKITCERMSDQKINHLVMVQIESYNDENEFDYMCLGSLTKRGKEMIIDLYVDAWMKNPD